MRASLRLSSTRGQIGRQRASQRGDCMVHLLGGDSRVRHDGDTSCSSLLRILDGIWPCEHGDSPAPTVCALRASRSEKAALLLPGARSERLAPRRRLLLCARSGHLALRRRRFFFLVRARSDSLPGWRHNYVCALWASRTERAALLSARCLCRLAANGLPAMASRWHGTCWTVGRDLWDLWAFPSAAEAAER